MIQVRFLSAYVILGKLNVGDNLPKYLCHSLKMLINFLIKNSDVLLK